MVAEISRNVLNLQGQLEKASGFYMSEVVAISRTSPTGRMQDIAPFDIEVAYMPPNGVIVVDKIRNVQFTENVRDWKEGDMNQQVELPLLPSHIEYGKPDGV